MLLETTSLVVKHLDLLNSVEHHANVLPSSPGEKNGWPGNYLGKALFCHHRLKAVKNNHPVPVHINKIMMVITIKIIIKEEMPGIKCPKIGAANTTFQVEVNHFAIHQ